MLAAPLAVLMWSQLLFAGYIKDDAFISLRYARNLIEGHGLVFNLSEPPLEGYSNFLWVLLEATGLALGAAPGPLASGLSMMAAALAVVTTFALARRLGVLDRDWTAMIAAVAFASTTTMRVWSQAGLEGPLLAAAMTAACLHLARYLETNRRADLADAAAWCVLAPLIRPEGHLLPLVVGAALLGRRREARRAPDTSDVLPPGDVASALALVAVGTALAAPFADGAARSRLGAELQAVVPVVALALVALWCCRSVVRALHQRALAGAHPALGFALTVIPLLAAYHAWRLTYFGAAMSNPYYVKAAAGWHAMDLGLEYLRGLATLDGLGVALALALVGVLPRAARTVRIAMASLVLAFLIYLVRIGGDEMPFYRLFLPALPLVLVLAGQGVIVVCERLRRGRIAARWMGVALAVCLMTLSSLTLSPLAPSLRGANAGLERAHATMARYVRARAQPGHAIIFQDMGAAPYAAGDLRWVDPIGLVEPFIARAQYEAGLSPYLQHEPTGAADQARAVDRRVRDHLFGQDPEWIAGVSYATDSPDAAAAFSARYREVEHSPHPSEILAVLMPGLHANGYYHGIFADRRFRLHYRFERAFRRSDGYVVVLFRRYDSPYDTDALR